MFQETYEIAKKNAQANANQTGVAWVVWSDTSGNHQICRAAGSPCSNANSHLVVHPELVTEKPSWLKTQLLIVPKQILLHALSSYTDEVELDENESMVAAAIGGLEDNLHDMTKEDAIDELGSIIGNIAEHIIDWDMSALQGDNE